MAVHLGLLCVLQHLLVAPFPAEVGEPVVVRATTPAGRSQGLPVSVHLPGGDERPIGATDAAGEVRFVPQAVGTHRFAVAIDDVRVVAPLEVVPARRRWLYAIACVPLGLALGYRIVRQWLGERGPRAAGPGGAGPGGAGPAGAGSGGAPGGAVVESGP